MFLNSLQRAAFITKTDNVFLRTQLRLRKLERLTRLRLSSSMTSDEFEWDDAKAAQNIRAHGVTFETACEVFRDPFALDWLDRSEDYGEERYARIGMAQGRLLHVAYTMRGERNRIISARGAERHEKRQYHEEND